MNGATRSELTSFIEKFNPNQEITNEFLETLAKLDTKPKPGDNSNHAEIVTDYFKKHAGLLELEKMWREHFLHTMKPKFLPEHWSVVYNENRLKLRAESGKLSENELAAAGLTQ